MCVVLLTAQPCCSHHTSTSTCTAPLTLLTPHAVSFLGLLPNNGLCGPAAGHTQASAAAVHPDIHSDPIADYRNLGLLQLLKKASRRRGGASVHSTNSAAQHSMVYAQTGPDVHSLGRAQSSLHSHAGQRGPQLPVSCLACMQLLMHTGACASRCSSVKAVTTSHEEIGV